MIINNNQTDLQERIKNTNKTCFMLQHFLKIKNIEETKIKTKEHNNRQNVNICSRNWTLTKRDRKQLNIF